MRTGISILRQLVFGGATLCAMFWTVTGFAASTLAPLTTFGVGSDQVADGWRAPFEVLPGDSAGSDSISPGLYNYLGNALDNTTVNAGNLERGLAYNPVTGHLILVSRNNGSVPGIRILDGTTGVDLGQLDQGTGIVTGGNFATNMIGIADDGAIYVANLSTNLTSSPYKVYRWANESATPTVAFSGNPGSLLSGARIGDTFDVIGSGANTRLVAGYAANPSVAGNNSFALFSTSDGSSFAGTGISIPTTPPEAGDFRLGITFTDSDSVIGKQGTFARLVDVNGSSGTLNVSFDTDGQTLRAMDYAVVAGKPLLAIMECSAAQDALGRARLFIYDMTDPTLPLVDRKLQEGSNLPILNPVTGPNQYQNINGTGQVKFGPINGNVATIYAMSTNNGVQAFTFTLDTAVTNSGDYNGNGVVDAADYILWRDTLGQAASPAGSGADGDGDGTIGTGDYDYWRARFGNTAGSGLGAGQVPEPTSISLLVIMMMGMAARRGQR